MTSLLSKTASKVSRVVGRRPYASAVVERSIRPSAWQSVFDLISIGNDKTMTSSSKVPKTFGEAMLEQKKAIVVTTAEAPQKIIYVNEAWERMCGFTKDEVIDKTLDCIQGADTNKELADGAVERLSKHDSNHVEEMYLINYKKNGTPFTNHLQMGTMKVNESIKDVKMFVGVLEEVQPSEVPLRMI